MGQCVKLSDKSWIWGRAVVDHGALPVVRVDPARQFSGAQAGLPIEVSIARVADQSGHSGSAFSLSLSVSNPRSYPIVFSLARGTLPAGLSLNPATGAITGTPTAVTAVSVQIRGVYTIGAQRKTALTNIFGINISILADAGPVAGTATLWLSALDAASMRLSGSDILTVTNKGTVGGTFTGLPVTTRPTLDPVGIGGRPAFLFDFTADSFRGNGLVAGNPLQSALNIFSSTALTCFVVIKHRTVDASFDQFVAGEDEQNSGDQSLRLTTGPKFGEVHASMYVAPSAGAVFGPLNPPLSSSTAVVYAYRLDPTNGYDVRVYTGAGHVAPGAHDTGPSFPGATLIPGLVAVGFAVARKTTATSILAFDGWIAKMFGFNTAFNNTQVDAQAAALCAEFGI